ncbi:MAG: hypothetical protein RIG82_09190 [Phycisphaeraceae bacterium]
MDATVGLTRAEVREIGLAVFAAIEQTRHLGNTVKWITETDPRPEVDPAPEIGAWLAAVDRVKTATMDGGLDAMGSSIGGVDGKRVLDGVGVSGAPTAIEDAVVTLWGIRSMVCFARDLPPEDLPPEKDWPNAVPTPDPHDPRGWDRLAKWVDWEANHNHLWRLRADIRRELLVLEGRAGGSSHQATKTPADGPVSEPRAAEMKPSRAKAWTVWTELRDVGGDTWANLDHSEQVRVAHAHYETKYGEINPDTFAKYVREARLQAEGPRTAPGRGRAVDSRSVVLADEV